MSISLLSRNSTALLKQKQFRNEAVSQLWDRSNDYLLLSFEDVLEHLGHFGDHRDEESVVGLIHEALVVLDLVVELLLDVVFHLVRDESARDFIGHLAEKSEVIGCEILVSFLIGDFKNANSMVSQLNWNEQNIAHDLVELLIHGHVVTELFPHVFIHRLLEVPRLSRIEDLAEDVLPILRRLPLETDRLS